jgi:pantoate--beta-alanine ligase
MQTLTSPTEMQAWADRARTAGRTIGFVPTMGALHDGHLALIDDASRRADDVVVSIFVNPLQFNESADFDGYPRPIDSDVTACERAGVAAVFAPTAALMYPSGFETRIVPGPLGDVMEGPNRPGHFEGVVTVVAKLFGAVKPHVAVFGQKDYQQLRIITQMSHDLNLGVEVVGHPTVREPDGLALSSRNVRLDAAQRRAAIVIPQALDGAIGAAAAGLDVAAIVDEVLSMVVRQPLAEHEYTTVFDAQTLAELTTIEPAQRRPGCVRIATAVWFGEVRLIDNRDLFEASAD